MGELNSESVLRFQVPCPNWNMVGCKNNSSQNMLQIFSLDQRYPMETEALTFSIVSQTDFPYRSSIFN